jgi:hypothetical protein
VKYRKLDSNGDYTFGFGNSNFYTDADAVTQAINTKLSMFQGEWWENINDGLPLFQQILGTSGAAPNISAIDLVVQARIMEAPNVNSIVSYSSSFSNRTYTASAVVETTYGNVTVEVNS